jgi:ABC-type proline/glycine betaine transport system permease subunit
MIDLAQHVRDHLVLSGAALLVALLLGLPLGALLARSGVLRGPGLAVVGIARVIPSLAVLAFMLPIVGIGFTPSLVALALLAIPPIAIATDLGLRGVPETIRDAARGLGLRSPNGSSGPSRCRSSSRVSKRRPSKSSPAPHWQRSSAGAAWANTF